MRWYALDVETATRTRGSVCEIAVVEFDEKKPTGKSFQSMVKPPQNRYDPEIQTRYNHNDTAAAPEWHHISERVGKVIGSSPVVAHYAMFDIGHLEALRKTRGTWAPDGAVFCSLKLARWSEPGLRSHSLENLVRHLNLLPVGEMHTALSDADACGRVFSSYAGERTVGDVMRAMTANPDAGTWAWLASTRDQTAPEPATGRQIAFIRELAEMPGTAGENGGLTPGADAILREITRTPKGGPGRGWWHENLTKNQASLVISFLLQLQPANNALRRKTAAVLEGQPYVEHELGRTGSGLWLLKVATVGPVILQQPPPPGWEVQVFCATAGEGTLKSLLEELGRRPN